MKGRYDPPPPAHTHNKICLNPWGRGVILTSLLGMCGAMSAADTVPYVFAAGTPIKASEVNANFTYLMNRGSQNTGVTGFDGISAPTITRSPPAQFPAIGSTVTIGGVPRTLGNWVIIAPGNGKRYRIVMPSIRSASDSPIFPAKYPDSIGSIAYPKTSFPVGTSTATAIYRPYVGFYNSTTTLNSTFSFANGVSCYLSIVLPDTTDVSIPLSMPSVSATPFTFDPFTQNTFSTLTYSTASMTAARNVTNAYLDDFIDYLTIEELP